MPSQIACPTTNCGSLQSVGHVAKPVTSIIVAQFSGLVAVITTFVPRVAVTVFPTNVPLDNTISVVVETTSLIISKV